MRKVLLLAALLGVVAATGLAYGQDEAQQKLLARRAAELDAYRKLAEMVQGLKIDSSTTVRDFVTQSDEIHTEFTHFIKGAETVGSPRYFDDGMCEVDMRLTLERIVTELKTIVKRYYHGDRFKDVQFDDIVKYVETKVIEVTGAGVPRTLDQFPKDMEDEYIDPAPAGGRARSPWADDPYWSSISPQGRLLAKRAAEADAYRKLGEMVEGLQITSETKVKDFMTESDKIQTELSAFLRHVQFVKYTYRPDGIVEAEAELTLERVITELKTVTKRYYQGDRYKDVQFDDIKKYTERKLVKVVGEGLVPERYAKPLPKREPAHDEPVRHEEKPAWAAKVLKATGEGVPPEDVDSEAEAYLKAKRAAELDALRKLAEMLDGVQVDSETTVRDFVTQSDKIKTEVQTLLSGFKVVGERTLEDGVTVEVDVELDLGGLYNIWKKYKGK
jgi:hypothetical protein